MKKTSARAERASIRGRGLPDDACPACGTMMRERQGRLRLPVNGQRIVVPSAAHLKGPKCGEIVLRSLEAKRLHEDAIAIYRKKQGLPFGRRDPGDS